MRTDLLAQVERWIDADPDPETAAALRRLVDARDEAALAELFAGRLAFGTAGLRAALGPGPLRMNRMVVRQTTAGLAAWVAANVDRARERGVFIGFDARRGSDVFALDAAGVLLAAGFRVVLAERLTATPVTAWGVVRYGCAAGIMVTASHNPPEDNGYKVYWGNGAQIIPPHDAGIANAIQQVADHPIACFDLEAAPTHARLERVAPAVEAEYLDAVLEQRTAQGAPPHQPLRIAYSAMHGVGAHLTLPLLQRAGYTDVHPVPQQNEPDGNFPTVRFPNPEEKGAIDLLLDLARNVDADVAIANDPDADRLAVAIPTPDGWHTLTGDETGVLLADYLLARSHAPHCVGTTVVSSRMLDAVANAHNATCFRTLTGFKWIANKAIDEKNAGRTFVFGYEEAIGFSVGELVRDKDGVSAALAIADLAASLKAGGKTIAQQLDALRRQHGWYATLQHSLKVDDGGKALSTALRANPPNAIGGIAVDSFFDLASTNRSGYPDPWRDLPATNALFWFLADGSRVIVRPSGTEPKVKVYLEVRLNWAPDESRADVSERATSRLTQLRDAFLQLVTP